MKRRARPHRHLVLSAAVSYALLAACGSPEPAVDNVVLVTLDTVRADQLGTYGYPRATTPFLDQLAARGAVFERAIASSSHTAPSHASLLTSLYPPQHRVLVNGQELPEDVITAAGLFRRAGYETAAVVSVRFLRKIARGFETIDKPRPGGRIEDAADGAPVVPFRPAEATVGRALRWLERRDPEKPFFLWVHLYDPHERHDESPYSEELLERMRTASPSERRRLLDYLRESRGLEPTAAEIEELDRYDAQIALADRQLERLDRALEAAGEGGGRTLWAVTADHGEGLGSHGYLYHDKYLYTEQVRVPLVLAGSPKWAGRKVEALVRHVDLLPTLLAATGVDGSPEWAAAVEGTSLLPLLAGSGDPPQIRFAYAQRRPATIPGAASPNLEGGLMIAGRTTRYKYIHSGEGEDEFYDLETDPLELVNLIAADSFEKTRLASWLLGKYGAMRAAGDGEDVDPTALDEETLRELRALGYL